MDELSHEQREALIRLVQSDRSLPRNQRSSFLAIAAAGVRNLLLLHQGLGADHLDIYPEDLRALGAFGLIRLRNDGHGYEFDITEFGYRTYDQIQKAFSAPASAIETETLRYLEDPGFQSRHRAAYAKWKAAADSLWSADAQVQLTQIGHLCREASQLFAVSFATMGEGANSRAATETKALVQDVLQTAAARLGTAKASFFQAIHAYWASTIDLIQRQEHGATKEGAALGWEDGRRVVFATLIAMYELDRALMEQHGP